MTSLDSMDRSTVVILGNCGVNVLAVFVNKSVKWAMVPVRCGGGAASRAMVLLISGLLWLAIGGCGSDGVPGPEGKGADAKYWSERLSHADKDERLKAIGELLTKRVAKDVALPGLRMALSDVDRLVRIHAASGIVVLKGHLEAVVEREVVSVISECLTQSESGAIRKTAATTLDVMGTHPKGAIMALGVASEDADPTVRAQVASAVAGYGSEATVLIPRLCTLLKDPNEEVRWSAAFALGELGKYASAAVEALRGAASDPVERVRSEADRAILRIEGSK